MRLAPPFSDVSDASEASNAPSAAGSPANASSEASSGDVATTPHVHAAGETAARNPNERPLPSFEGTTLDGKPLSIRDLLGARILLFFFNPETEVAPTVGRAVNAIAAQAAAHNFKVVGIGIGSDSSKVARFASDLGLTFPVIDDSSGSITQRLRLRAPNALIGVDAEGYLAFVVGGFPKEGDAEAIVEADLRSKLRLPEPGGQADGALYDYPKAPKLGVVSMSDGARLETSDLEGRAALVIFFLHTCPHCHKALASLKTTLAGMPEETRPRLVAVSVQNAPSAIRSSLEEQGLDYFDPYLDPGSEAAERWGVTGGVPVVVVVDKQGRIRHRSIGWDEKRDPGIIRMMLAKVAGERVPMLLDPTGYSGNDVCGICHEQEYATWQYTAHASAYDTLVTHAAERRTDCIGCHVVGFEQPGGYDFKRQEPYLENVGCESCHGRGGPHLTPEFRAEPRLQPGLRDLPQPETFSRLRLRDLPSAHLPRGDRGALGCRPRQAARRGRTQARSAADPSRLRRIGCLRVLPREGVRDLAGESPRTRHRPAREGRKGCRRGVPGLPYHGLRQARRLPAEVQCRRPTGPRPRRLRVVSRTRRRSRRQGRPTRRYDPLARRQM